MPPTHGLEDATGAKDIPKEPTRIVNLRRRLHRIQNTKAKLAQVLCRKVVCSSGGGGHKQWLFIFPAAGFAARHQGYQPPPTICGSGIPLCVLLLALLNLDGCRSFLPPLKRSNGQQPPPPFTPPLNGGFFTPVGCLFGLLAPPRSIAQAWGPQPDNRQMAALEAEPAILWEIQQWEQFGVLANKSSDDGNEPHKTAAGSGELMRDSSTLTEPYKDPHEGVCPDNPRRCIWTLKLETRSFVCVGQPSF